MEAQLNNFLRNIRSWSRKATIQTRDTFSDIDWTNLKQLWVKTQVILGDSWGAMVKGPRDRA